MSTVGQIIIHRAIPNSINNDGGCRAADEVVQRYIEVVGEGNESVKARPGVSVFPILVIPFRNTHRYSDISFIPTMKGMVYLCAVMDLCGKMVLAYRIGGDMASSLVTDTVRDAMQSVRRKEMAADGLILHSDQGFQYTSQAYFDLGQEYHFKPSMSSLGCPYDNAAMKNFFGTLKTECLYRIKFSCRTEGEHAIAEYVQYYNFERINLKKGLTPAEIRSKAL